MYKLTSLIISIITFILGITILITYFAINKSLPSKDEAIGLGVFLLAINSVTGSIDISMIIKNIKELANKNITLQDGINVIKDVANDVKTKIEDINNDKT